MRTSICLCFLCAIFVLSSIEIHGQERSSAGNSQKKVVVCSTTQVADFARQILGDDWQIECVLGAGQDPHTYEEKVTDAALVSKADLCLQNGWNLEGHGWMEKLAHNAGKPIVSCTDGIEPIVLDSEKDTTAKDPHAWFDPRNAAIYVKNILRACSKMDPDNADRFKARAELYMQQLAAIHTWVQSKVVEIPAERRILVTHHDAFAYFCKAYNFQAVSPAGWTTEELSGITLEDRQAVVKAIRDAGVRSIFIETSLDSRTINEIGKEAGVEIGGSLYSDAMGPAGSAGETYIGMLRENVLTIVKGLK